MKTKKRLDQRVQEIYPELSRTLIQSYIMQGKVRVNDMVESKSGTLVTETDIIHLLAEKPKYVCRAGWKLEKALDEFAINPSNLTILDAGLSTGGFTDCLLQRGAKKIYGVDVGYGQVHEKIRHDERVILYERTNLRHLKELPEKVDLVTLDLSFISLLKVMDTITSLIKNSGTMITLIKPQFEAERHEIGRGGIIKDPKIHQAVVEKVIKGIEAYGFKNEGLIESPILGSSGNKEYLALFKRIV